MQKKITCHYDPNKYNKVFTISDTHKIILCYNIVKHRLIWDFDRKERLRVVTPYRVALC